MLSVCALSSVGHAQDIPGRERTARLPTAAAELDGCADVHADTAIAAAAATPKTPATRPGRRRPRPKHDHGLAIAVPSDLMLASIDTSLSAGNSGTVVACDYLLYNL